MPPSAAQPRRYAMGAAALLIGAGAFLGVGAGGLAALLGMASVMFATQAVLLRRSLTTGLPAEVDRLRALLMVGEDETLLDLGADAERLAAAGDASVDAVLGVHVLTRLADDDARRSACTDLARVLRPGGRLGLLEARGTHAAVLALEDEGLAAVERSDLRWAVWPPVRAITARR
jgi:SAM-dependent methyltransferase